MCHSLLLNSMETANEGQGKRNISTTLLLDRHWQGKKTRSLQGIIVFRGKKGRTKEVCVCVCAPHSHISYHFIYSFISSPAIIALKLWQQLEVKIQQNTHRLRA